MTEQTNEVSFEEQFPSLKDDTAVILYSPDGIIKYIYEQGGYFLGKKDIQKYCLDKQKVRYVIIKLRFDESGKGDYILDANRLLKELGLDDDKE